MDRMLGCDTVEFLSRRVALFLEPRDENLPDINPTSFGKRLRTCGDVVQQLRDVGDVGDRMIELVDRGGHRVAVAVHQAGEDHFPFEIDHAGVVVFCRENGDIITDSSDALACDGHGADDAKVVIDGDDLSTMQNQVGRCVNRSCKGKQAVDEIPEFHEGSVSGGRHRSRGKCGQSCSRASPRRLSTNEIGHQPDGGRGRSSAVGECRDDVAKLLRPGVRIALVPGDGGHGVG